MSTQPRVTHTAEILDISAFRPRSVRTVVKSSKVTADLLSIRQKLDFRASVEIDQLTCNTPGIDSSVRNRLIRDVRSLLDAEFGNLRINCDKNVFQVRNRSLETLIAGLLRCQFHARQIAWTLSDDSVEGTAFTGLGLTWGVGDSLDEAEADRVKRRSRKNKQV